MAYRNGLRLLKLVNSLLDFARIEAGRVQANYEATDLAAFTADLASSFRSATDKAGLRLIVDCPPLPQPVYVDRDMWEKVVLNLISNAFKFTSEGEIEVRLEPATDGSVARLSVRDTGTGIPPEEMSRLFERFHRVEGTRGRTHEGTGIGLALVQELVKLHGGSISVESELGRGSAFSVHIPFGIAHLPPGMAFTEPSTAKASTATRAVVYVDEALGWLPLEGEQIGTAKQAQDRESFAPSFTASFKAELDGSPRQATRGRVLLADDNADMRGYVSRLLSPHFDVEAVSDGQEALKRALNRPPDLILSDIMMPGLDGFALLKALRTESSTRTLPVILLSARAGEESRVEGIEAGADDYLVKPFTARELLARVTTHLAMSRLRRQAAERERELRRESEAARERATSAAEALRQANSDLEQFAFSASHDLQEPLRMVATFSQLLQVKYAGKLDEDADTIIEHCVEGASRMGRMIRDLLEYTRAASISASQPEMVSLEEALDEALGNLQASIDESKATVTHDPLPVTRRLSRFICSRFSRTWSQTPSNIAAISRPASTLARFARAMPGGFPCRIMESASNPDIRIKCSDSSSACIAARDIRVPAWAWPSARSWWNVTTGGFGWNPNRAPVPHFSSRWHQANWRKASGPDGQGSLSNLDCRGQPGGCVSDRGSPAALRIRVSSGDRRQWRRHAKDDHRNRPGSVGKLPGPFPHRPEPAPAAGR